jgi:hypothetical protein
LDDKTGLLLSQTVKYSIKKGTVFSLELLISILKTAENKEIKSEIAFALGYGIQNSKELLK